MCGGCDAYRKREEGITTTAVTTIKMEELVEMAQLVEEEEEKKEEEEENSRGFFQWQDTLVRKVHILYKIMYDTLVFSISLAE